jgi:MFS family permease
MAVSFKTTAISSPYVSDSFEGQGDVMQRAVLLLLAATTAISAAGLAAGGTAAALIGTHIAGSDAASGVPLGCVVIGSAFGALTISRLAAAIGRGRSLATGYGIGCIGAAIVIGAAETSSFGLLCVGNILYGAANAAIFLTRYAAADVSGGSGRGRAIGLIFFGTAVGAVVSPALLGPSGDLAMALGLTRLSGMYVVALCVFAAAALMLVVQSRVRTDGEVPALRRRVGQGAQRADVFTALRNRPTRSAIAFLAVANLLMVGVMAVAPVRMMTDGHGLQVIGFVVSAHVAGMFLPSPLSGWAADRFDPGRVATVGIALLVAAGVWGTLRPQASPAAMTASLVVLGVAWNVSVVGASTLLVASLPERLRTEGEGIGEVAMGLAAAVAAPVAGVVVALAGLVAIWLAVAVVAVVAIATTSRAIQRDVA